MNFTIETVAIIITSYWKQKVNSDDYTILYYLKKMNSIHCGFISKKISKCNSIVKKHLIIIKGN